MREVSGFCTGSGREYGGLGLHEGHTRFEDGGEVRVQ